MAAAGVRAAQVPFSGLRPVNLRRDLAAIADLIEVCFAPTLDAAGRSAIQEMRALSRTGPLVWGLGRLGSVMAMSQGFVWYEAGRLVGNVSIGPTEYDHSLVIANVAVSPDYRRRGIARQLVQAALDQAARQGVCAMLQVEAANSGARCLYESLGFVEQRTFTRWRRTAQHSLPPFSSEKVTLHRLGRRDAPRLYALAQRARPAQRGGMGWLRPLRIQDFRPPRWGALAYLVSGKYAVSWGLDGRDGALDAALIIEDRLSCLTQVFDLLVCPEHSGELAGRLLASLLDGRQRPLLTDHPADDEGAGAALRACQFRAERTLVHMLWTPPGWSSPSQSGGGAPGRSVGGRAAPGSLKRAIGTFVWND